MTDVLNPPPTEKPRGRGCPSLDRLAQPQAPLRGPSHVRCCLGGGEGDAQGVIAGMTRAIGATKPPLGAVGSGQRSEKEPLESRPGSPCAKGGASTSRRRGGGAGVRRPGAPRPPGPAPAGMDDGGAPPPPRPPPTLTVRVREVGLGPGPSLVPLPGSLSQAAAPAFSGLTPLTPTPGPGAPRRPECPEPR